MYTNIKLICFFNTHTSVSHKCIHVFQQMLKKPIFAKIDLIIFLYYGAQARSCLYASTQLNPHYFE